MYTGKAGSDKRMEDAAATMEQAGDQKAADDKRAAAKRKKKGNRDGGEPCICLVACCQHESLHDGDRFCMMGTSKYI